MKASCLALTAAAALTCQQPALAETEAETAARTQRGLTSQEFDRLRDACALPTPSPQAGGFPAALGATIIDLPEQTLLAFLVLRPNPDKPGSKNATISKYEDLPKGGIGRRDYCDVVQLSAYPSPEGAVKVMALRLRPGLNLATDYPTAFREIAKRGQLIHLKPARYGLDPT